MDMTILQAIFLGVVQGLTEFIPVSSSAHVTLIPELFGWERADTLFVLFVHFGTLIALLIYFRHKLWRYVVVTFTWAISKGNLENKDEKRDWRVVLLVVLAAIPAGILGLIFSDTIEHFYDSGEFSSIADLSVIMAMAGVGVLFLFNEELFGGKKVNIDRLGPAKAVFVGLTQALAFVRGISRSGITLLSGQMAGLSRVNAAEFSFLMSIPILLGTSTLSLLQVSGAANELGQQTLLNLVAGGTAAAVSGYFAISFMLNYLKNNSLKVFGWYRLIFAILVLILIFY